VSITVITSHELQPHFTVTNDKRNRGFINPQQKMQFKIKRSICALRMLIFYTEVQPKHTLLFLSKYSKAKKSAHYVRIL
jgi:hypothetical protein